MIAIDTSSLRRYLSGQRGDDVEAVAIAVEQRQAVLPPVVLTEILSDPELQSSTIRAISELPAIELLDGFWVRAGLLRAKVLVTGRKTRVADALIAQGCIDHGAPLITHDRDFRHYVKHGLRLV